MKLEGFLFRVRDKNGHQRGSVIAMWKSVSRLVAALLLTGSVSMAGDAQQVSSLTPKDVERLAQQRAAIEKYLGDEHSKQNYKTAAGKLGLLRALIEKRVFKPSQTYELQSMGIVLGDAFVQELGMEWVIVQDAYGRDPAVRLHNHFSAHHDLQANRKR